MQAARMAAVAVVLGLVAGCASHPTGGTQAAVDDGTIAAQRSRLAHNTAGKGFGPQSPRDIDVAAGSNTVTFAVAPPAARMNLCNIHFHKNAEHKGGEFTRYAGHGDGHGTGSGYRYAGTLSAAELRATGRKICAGGHGELVPGDTIEVHYVYSTAAVGPGPTLGACMNEATKNPQLRVEAQTYVLVNDPAALDFMRLTQVGQVNGFQQALHIPQDTGTPVQYAGSTTGPAYNEAGSPFQVSWSVRPRVAKVRIETVGTWCEGNVFKEDHAHGVRTLVVHPGLLSEIRK
jgi:hypothetical protein